jgi:transketolase
MRRASLQAVENLARTDKRVCFIGSDLGYGVMDNFPAPERLFREGISEQHVIGMAAGLALGGKVVYVNSIAAFLTRRCYEQVYLDLCLNRAKVRILASGGGLVYAPLGPTHLAPDDFALLRPLPNMTILAPCDADEMRRLMPLTLDIDGPVYVRFAKGGDKVVSPASDSGIPYAVGKAVTLRDGADALLVTTGVTAQMACEAADILAREGIAVGVLHCHTMKPLDEAAIMERARTVNMVVTVEEHLRCGGLGSAVGDLFADQNTRKRLMCISLDDKFYMEHGSQRKALESRGLFPGRIAWRIRRAMRDSMVFQGGRDDL